MAERWVETFKVTNSIVRFNILAFKKKNPIVMDDLKAIIFIMLSFIIVNIIYEKNYNFSSGDCNYTYRF